MRADRRTLLFLALLLPGCQGLEPYSLPEGSPSCRIRVHNAHDLTFWGELEGRFDLGPFPPRSDRSIDLAPGRHALLFRAWIPWESDAASLVFRCEVEARADDAVRISLPAQDQAYEKEPRGVELGASAPGSTQPQAGFTW